MYEGDMSSRKLLPGLLLVLLTMTGCSQLGRASSSDDVGQDESIFGGSVEVATANDLIVSDAKPAEQMEVSWKDGGNIRAMSGPGQARTQAVPQNKIKKSGRLAAAKN